MKDLAKRFMALLLTAVMAAGLMPATCFDAAAAEAGQTISVTVSVYDDGYKICPVTLEAAPDETARYGLGHDDDTVSVYDAIVALHREQYGDAFTADTAADYIVNSGVGEGVYLTKQFGVEKSSGFLVNDQMVTLEDGYGADAAQAVLKDGDVVSVFFYNDNVNWNDQYAKIACADEAKAGEPFEVTVTGASAMMGGEEIPMAGATVYAGASCDAMEAVGTTDANGSLKIKAEDAGDLYLYAGGTAAVGETQVPVIGRLQKVSVVYAAKWVSDKYLAGSGIVKNGSSDVLIVGDYVVSVFGNSLLVLDKQTGKEVKRVELSAGAGYALSAPVLADGKIIVAVNGTIQALDADTFETLWVYTNALGGQANSPVVCSDGLVYTGFWKRAWSATAGENCVAQYVAVDANTGKEVWTLSHPGGFYFAGAYTDGTDLYVGSETSSADKTGTFFVLDAKTGEVKKEIPVAGNIRSGVSADKDTGCLYFTSQGKLFCRYDPAADTMKTLDIGAVSTSTPLICNGRAYIGASDKSIKVIDAADMSVIYSASAKKGENFGYPQGRMVLTADEETGAVCVYTTYNAQPGGVCVLKDKPGQTAGNVETVFTPEQPQQQYCVNSLVTDEQGVLYYRNDSGYIMALDKVRLGDMDADGKITVKDALDVLKCVVWNNKDTLSAYTLTNGDVDQDKNITVKDALEILKKVVWGEV